MPPHKSSTTCETITFFYGAPLWLIRQMKSYAFFDRIESSTISGHFRQCVAIIRDLGFLLSALCDSDRISCPFGRLATTISSPAFMLNVNSSANWGGGSERQRSIFVGRIDFTDDPLKLVRAFALSR